MKLSLALAKAGARPPLPGPFQSSGERFQHEQVLGGALLLPASAPSADEKTAHNWPATELVEHKVTLSVVAAFSPSVEDHARLMFEDKFDECRFHALGPAMATWRGAAVTCVRLFLAQYLQALTSRTQQPGPVDAWQENYVYCMRLRLGDYEPLEAGRLLGIPVPTNNDFSYRKDGPMDPRAFLYKERLFLIYYSHGAPEQNTRARCRMYFWDYERSVKKLISVSGIHLLDADINWSPLVVGGDTLYLVYTFDPLRVLHCDPDAGHCMLHYAQPGAERLPFERAADALRGGTPFVEYAHPYYFSIAHSAVSLPHHGTKTAYAAHVAIVSVDPWHLVYVSAGIEADEHWLNSKPLALSDYVAATFWYPTALLPDDDSDDAYDIGCHVNDHSSYVLRLAGLRTLIADVVARHSSALSASVLRAELETGSDGAEQHEAPHLQLPPPRTAQRYVIDERLRNAGFAEMPRS